MGGIHGEPPSQPTPTGPSGIGVEAINAA
jgi:hypothetical protein